MANAWDNDPISSGNAWDADPIDTPVEGKKKKINAKDILPSDEEVGDVLSKLQGVGEAGWNLLTGATSGGLGAISGTIAGIRQHGLGTDEQRKKVEAEAARQMDSLTFTPKTEKGQEYAEQGAKAMEQLIPIAPMAAELEGALMASKNARTLKRAGKDAALQEKYAPDVPLPLDEALAQADVLPENQRQMMGPQRPVWMEDPIVEPVQSKRAKMQMDLPLEEPAPALRTTPEGDVLRTPEEVAAYEQFGRKEAEPLQGQGDLFMNDEMGGAPATPFNAAERGALPDVQGENPRLARRQMDLQLEGDPMFADREGGVTRDLPDPTRVIEESPEQVAEMQRIAEAKVREEQAKAAVENGETGNLFADYVNQHRDYELFRDENGKPLGRKEFNETIDNLSKEKSTGYVRPEDMDAAYAKYLQNFDGVQAGLFDQPTTAKEMADTLRNDAAERMTANHPLVKAAEKFLNQEQQFLDQLRQQGASLEAIADASRDVVKAQERLTKTQENVNKSIKSGSRPSALRKQRSGGLNRKQSGATSTDFLTSVLSLGVKDAFNNLKKRVVEITPGENKTKYLPQGVKKGLEDYTKERRSAEDITADIAKNNIPDIKDTPLTDKVQAGGLYKSLETNNPIVRKTFAAVSDAYHRAHENIRWAIQDPKEGIPALFRGLSKDEAADLWAYRAAREGVEDVTPQQLKAAGFNDKQIALSEKLNASLKAAFDNLNEARAIAGKNPIDPRVGYLAGQASGNFRTLIYKRGTNGKEIVGVIGSDVRKVMQGRVKKILAEHPEWEAGNETTARRGKRDPRQKAFEDAVELLAENNPDTRRLMDTYENMLRDDAYNYMNAKKHTMDKKGISGTEGFKLDVDAFTNAKEGIASQVRYLEKMFQWSEMSKAVREVQPLLTNDAINMPNAKKWSNDYIDRALGIQTSDVGAAIDGMLDAVGKKVGVGPSLMQEGVGVAKNAVSKVLLGFVNPGFLAINMMQPVMATPAIMSLMKSRGVANASALAMPKAIMTMGKISMNGKMGALSAFEKAVKEQGSARNIFGSEIFDHGNYLSKKAYYGNRVAQLGIPLVENATRGTVFTAYAHILNDAKVPHSKLFDIAENLTNQTMTDYRSIEAPSMYSELGSLGQMAVTLQRFKHNSLSSMAMLTREAARNKSYRPIGTALATSLAFSGLTGMLGFNEADQLYQLATKAMGKPDTLTRLLMDSVGNDTLNFGAVSALSGIDMSKRFGMALFPDSPSGAIFPGVSRLAETAGSLFEAARNPSEVNVQRAVRDVAPNSLRGALERKFFEDDDGLAHNVKTLQGTVERDATDKFAKSLGLQGMHESKEKNRLYQERLVDQAITDKRTSTVDKMFQDLYPLRNEPEKVAEYFQSERGQELRQKFIDNEGSVDNLVSSVLKFMQNTKLTDKEQKMLAASAAVKEGDLKKAQRYMKATGNER